MKFFSRMLSSAGSKFSPISSIKRGRPSDKLSSKWFLKYLWFNEVIWDQNRGQKMSSVAITASRLLGNFHAPKNTAVITEHTHTFKN